MPPVAEARLVRDADGALTLEAVEPSRLDKREREVGHEERKKVRASSDVSPAACSDFSCAQRHKEEKAKHKSHKHKSHKSHKRSRRSDSDDSGDPKVSAVSALPLLAADATIPTLSADDYFIRNVEFSWWLQQTRATFFTQLPGSEARALFNSFVADWNARLLPAKLYAGEIAISGRR
jgi:hypothetical protein